MKQCILGVFPPHSHNLFSADSCMLLEKWIRLQIFLAYRYFFWIVFGNIKISNGRDGMSRAVHALCKCKWSLWGEKGSATKGLWLLVSNGQGILTGHSLVLQAVLTGKWNYLHCHTALMERVKANTNWRGACKEHLSMKQVICICRAGMITRSNTNLWQRYLQFVLETQAWFFLLCMHLQVLPYVDLLNIYMSGVIQDLHRSVV